MARRRIDASQALFTDFSKGLYLLDTPRGYGDQLTSLALTGGRNVWSEKGALVPQYGYDVKALIPNNEKVLLISDDDQSSSSIFIVTQDIKTNKGNVYLYTASQGLRKYKTQIPSITAPIITARTGTNLILTTAGVNYEFGAYYPESVEVVLNDNLDISTFTSYYEITIPDSSRDYYWNGKEIAIKSSDKIVPSKVVSINNSGIKESVPITFDKIGDYINQNIPVVFEVEFTIEKPSKSSVVLFNTSQEYYSEGYIGYNLGATIETSYIEYRCKPSNYIETDNPDDILRFDRKYIEEGAKYLCKIYLNDKNEKVTVELFKNGEFCDVLDSKLDFKIFRDYYIKKYSEGTVNSAIVVKANSQPISYILHQGCVLRLVTQQGTQHQTLTGKVSLLEKTLNTLTFKYTPEQPTESNPEKIITPKVMGFCANRLCISDVGGIIYYSGVGVVDNFKESLGAGYFGGFSDDNSECLALEDYYNGVLITKQNGLYFLAFGADSTSSVNQSTISITIKKIAQIGQEYAKDHVIIDKKIIAYDSNSASLLVAAAVNVFGSLVAGKTLVTAEELNAQSFGIPEQKRQLVYNSEAQVLILYYGEQLKNGIVYVPASKAIFPREMDLTVEDYQGFNQGVIGVSENGKLFEDFKKGTLIENLTSIATFEPIGLRDNRMICASVMEISELNGIEYALTTTNTQTSLQYIHPSSVTSRNGKNTPPMLYSDKMANLSFDSFSTQRKWADKTSNCTRVYAPMSGRYGVNLSFEFPKAEAFCLAAILINDFSQGG